MSPSIISGPLSPEMSMSVNIGVTVGRNQVQRNQGNYSAIYLAPSSRIGQDYVELASLDVLSSNPNEFTHRLVVSTSGPLLFEAVNQNDEALKFTVNKALVIDDVLKSFKLTNEGTAVVRLNYNTVSAPAP